MFWQRTNGNGKEASNITWLVVYRGIRDQADAQVGIFHTFQNIESNNKRQYGGTECKLDGPNWKRARTVAVTPT